MQVSVLVLLVPALALLGLDAGEHPVAAERRRPQGGARVAAPDLDRRAVVLRPGVDPRRRGVGEVRGDVAGVELDRRQRVVELDEGGAARGGVAGVEDAAVAAHQQPVRIAADERAGVVIDVDVASGVAAGQVDEGRAAVGRAEQVHRADEHHVGIHRIHGHALVVPVLPVVALAPGQPRGVRALLPGGPAVHRAPDPELSVARDRRHLRVEHVGVAGRDPEVDPSQRVRRIGRAAAGARRPAVVAAGEQLPGGRAAAARDRGAVDPVGAVLVEIRLDGGVEAARADRGVDLGRAAGVADDQAGDVLALGREGVRLARARPGRAGVVGEEQPGLGADDHAVAVAWVDLDLADRLVLREGPRRLGVDRREDVGAEDRPARPGVGGLEDARRAEGPGGVVQVTGPGVDGVGIVGVDLDVVDRDRGEERVVGRRRPGGRGAAAVRRLPDPAAHRAGVSDRRRHRIAREDVDPPRRAPELAVEGLGAERGEGVGIEVQRRDASRRPPPRASGGHAAGQSAILGRGRDQPAGVEVSGRIGQPDRPVVGVARAPGRLALRSRGGPRGDRTRQIRAGVTRAPATRRESGQGDEREGEISESSRVHGRVLLPRASRSPRARQTGPRGGASYAVSVEKRRHPSTPARRRRPPTGRQPAAARSLSSSAARARACAPWTACQAASARARIAARAAASARPGRLTQTF